MILHELIAGASNTSMTNYLSVGVSLILVTVFLLIQTARTINANTPDSGPHTTINYIQNSDVKNTLIAVHNDTPHNYLKLTNNQIDDALTDLLGWTVVNGKLHKTFVFEDFPTLFDFMFKVANFSQVVNHHPNMTSTFDTLTLDYDTWSIGPAISDVDIQAANHIEMIYGAGIYTEGNK